MSVSALAEFVTSLDEEDQFKVAQTILEGKVQLQRRIIEDGTFCKLLDELRAFGFEDPENLPPEIPKLVPQRTKLMAAERTARDWWSSFNPCDLYERMKDIEWIETMESSIIFGALIIANAIFLGVEVDYREGAVGGAKVMWDITEYTFTLAFTLELYLRIRLHRWATFKNSWNNFDAFLVALGINDSFIVSNIDLGDGSESSSGTLKMLQVLRMMRLLKLLRIVRLFRMFSDLWVLLRGLLCACRSLGWVMLMLGMVKYVSAIVLTKLIGKEYGPVDDQINEYWGTVPSSVYSLFVVMTGEEWVTIADESAEHMGGPFRLFFVMYILFTDLALVNLVTGVIVDKVVMCTRENEIDQMLELGEGRDVEQKNMVTLFQLAERRDENGEREGYVDEESFCHAITSFSEAEKALRDLDVYLGVKPPVLFNVLDCHGHGKLDAEDFADGLTRIKGSNHSKHLLFVHSDLHTLNKMVDQVLVGLTQQMHDTLERAESTQNWVRDLWHLMQKAATNRWSSDPFHSSLHQMVGNIHEQVQLLCHQTGVQPHEPNKVLSLGECGDFAEEAVGDAPESLTKLQVMRPSKRVEPAPAPGSFGCCAPTLASQNDALGAISERGGVSKALEGCLAVLDDPALYLQYRTILGVRPEFDSDASRLRLAVRRDDLPEVQRLLDAKASAQEIDPTWGLTLLDELRPGSKLQPLLVSGGATHSLFYAASRGDYHLTRELVAAQANVSATNAAGMRVMDFAQRSPLIRQALTQAGASGTRFLPTAPVTGLDGALSPAATDASGTGWQRASPARQSPGQTTTSTHDARPNGSHDPSMRL